MTFVPEETKLHKGNSVVFKLRVNPTDNNSPQIESTMRVLSGEEGVRPALQHRRELQRVVIGLNATTGPQIYAIVQQTLSGRAKDKFVTVCEQLQQTALRDARETAAAQARANGQNEAAARNAVNQPEITGDIVDEALKEVVTMICPYKAYQRVKRWIRRRVRKATDMSIRDFYNHLLRINNQEIPAMPPNFSHDQSLPEDEIIDILLYAIPNSWKKEMDKQGFDIDRATPQQVVDICEQIEASESHDSNGSNNNNNKSKSNEKNGKSNKKAKKSHDKTKGNSNNNDDYYCMYHKKNDSHDTKDCKVLKALAEAKSTKDHGGTGNKNKTWSRKKDGENKSGAKDLKVLVNQAVKEELKSMSRKRKSDSDDDDDEINLQQFNYDMLDEMSVASA